MAFVILDKKLDLASLLFTAEGRKVTVLEREGNAVTYRSPITQREEVGTVNRDVFMLGQLKTFEARIAAFSSCAALQGGGSKDAPIGIKTAGFGCVCIFNGSLAYRFFKQGGRVPHFAPASSAEAKGLIDGTHELKYIKGTSRFRISTK